MKPEQPSNETQETAASLPGGGYGIRRIVSSQKFRFLAAGGFNTVSGYLLTNVFYWLLIPAVPLMLFLIIVTVINITISFVTYKLFVFQSKGGWLAEYVRFYGVSLIPIALGFVLLPLLIKTAKLNPYAAIAITTALTVVISYVGHKHFSFKQSDVLPDDR